MKSVRHVLLATSAMALGAIGASGVGTSPAPPSASAASAHQPGTPGSPMLATQQAPVAPRDRRQWLQVRATRRRFPTWTGTHKQNRRKQLKRNQRRGGR